VAVVLWLTVIILDKMRMNLLLRVGKIIRMTPIEREKALTIETSEERSRRKQEWGLELLGQRTTTPWEESISAITDLVLVDLRFRITRKIKLVLTLMKSVQDSE
jgi:hypothetical protein